MTTREEQLFLVRKGLELLLQTHCVTATEFFAGAEHGKRRKWHYKVLQNLCKNKMAKLDQRGRICNYYLANAEGVQKLLDDSYLIVSTLLEGNFLENTPVKSGKDIVNDANNLINDMMSGPPVEEEPDLTELQLKLMGGLIDKMDRIERQNIEILEGLNKILGELM